MFKRIDDNVNNTIFNLRPAFVIALLAGVGGFPTNGSANVRVVTQSGIDTSYPLNAQDVTDFKAAGLSGFNNDLIFLRKSEIESVTLIGYDFYPSGGNVPVSVRFKNGFVFNFTPMDENTYNSLMS